MAHNFCRHLSNSYRFTQIDNQLHYSPCCFTPTYPITSKQDVFEKQKVATAAAEQDPTNYCNQCLKTEQAGFRHNSRRTSALDYIPADAVDSVPYTLEIQIDITCNAACVTCGPYYSTLWLNELGKPISKKYNISTQLNYDQLPSLIDFSTLKEIRFFGGEPFMNLLHLQVLSYVLDPSKVDLLYSTNGGVKPTEYEFSIIKKFKNVNISFSIDDIKERFEYVRWPIKWDTLENNIKYFSNNLPNANFKIHSTVNPLTLYYVKDLESWAKEFALKNNINLTQHTLNPCYGLWGIDSTPPGLREYILTQYSVHHPIVKILNNYLEIPYNFEKLENNMNLLDIKRKQNWKKTFPDIVKYFK